MDYKDQTDAEETEGKYLIFSSDGTDYGVGIGYVTEIIPVQPITRVPNAPSYLKGIINVRGTILPVMDLRLRFGREAAEYDEHTCIVALNVDNNNVGLIVDGVKDVIRFADEDVLKPPASSSDQKRYLSSIGKSQDGSIKQLVNIHRIFGTED